MKRIALFGAILAAVLYTAYGAYGQSSTNYELRSYEFGSGGGVNMSATGYLLEGIAGEIAGKQSSTNYMANSGLNFYQQAHVPSAPTVANTGDWHNKLKVTINKWSGDPTDAKYAIAASTDNFASDVRYVQSDNTIGASLGAEDFQTYATWGGASGFNVIGLTSSTTYTFKVKSTEGRYTESPWGPTANAATSALEVSFDIDVGGASDPGETAAPYTIAFGNLTPGSVSTATDRIWVDFATNADNGGYIFVYDQNAGLKSTALNYTVTSATADLSGASTGFGLKGASKTQSSGGPLEYTSPYNGSSENVGIVSTTIREIFNTTSASIVGGRGSVQLKAKVSSVTPAANDYADTITLVATAAF